jgi:hypothetical protein
LTSPDAAVFAANVPGAFSRPTSGGRLFLTYRNRYPPKHFSELASLEVVVERFFHLVQAVYFSDLERIMCCSFEPPKMVSLYLASTAEVHNARIERVPSLPTKGSRSTKLRRPGEKDEVDQMAVRC